MISKLTKRSFFLPCLLALALIVAPDAEAQRRKKKKKEEEAKPAQTAPKPAAKKGGIQPFENVITKDEVA